MTSSRRVSRRGRRGSASRSHARHPEADAREVDDDVADRGVAAADRDLVGRRRHQRPGDRIEAVVVGRDASRAGPASSRWARRASTPPGAAGAALARRSQARRPGHRSRRRRAPSASSAAVHARRAGTPSSSALAAGRHAQEPQRVVAGGVGEAERRGRAATAGRRRAAPRAVRDSARSCSRACGACLRNVAEVAPGHHLACGPP